MTNRMKINRASQNAMKCFVLAGMFALAVFSGFVLYLAVDFTSWQQ